MISITHQCNECGTVFPIQAVVGPEDSETRASCPRCRKLFVVAIKDGELRVIMPKKKRKKRPKRVESFREKVETK